MRFLTAVCLIFLAALPARADIFQADSFTLDNGLQVVVVENHRAPVVSHMVWYKTGGIDDPLGKSGIAHVLEHMMFKGTPAVPDGEFSKIIARNGGTENAFTSLDYTAYFQNIARDRLELVMFLEADRMKNLRFSEKDFVPELEVVKEERLMRYDNSPGMILAERKARLLWGDHPYGRPVIGTKKELAALQLKDAQQFYQTHYAPDNAVLVVAGDITAEELKPLAEKYYGKVPPSRTAVAKRQFTLPFPVKSRIEMRHPQTKIYTLYRDYIVPSYISDSSEQSFSYAVLGEILGTYNLGKMHKYFINRKKSATRASAGYNGFSLDRGTFYFALTSAGKEDLPELEKQLDGFLNPSSITQQDVDKAKKRLVSDLEYLNDDPGSAADIVGRFYVLGLSVEDLRNWKENIGKVTLADVRKAYAGMIAAPSVTTYLMPEANTP